MILCSYAKNREGEPMSEYTNAIMEHWGFKTYRCCKQFHVNSKRIIEEIETNRGTFILKGLPDDISEVTIQHNLAAHEFLGNRHHITPCIIYPPKGLNYLHTKGYYFYVIEFIHGRNLCETIEDEYALGKLVRKLHFLQGYPYPCSFDSEDKIRQFYTWFPERHFKKEFDALLGHLPNFKEYPQCMIHTDIGPHNAMQRTNQEYVFIDLDDAGIGCSYIDAGWPLIMQFVDFNHTTLEKKYRFDLAKAYLKGYFEPNMISRQDYELLWSGAIYMHIAYMKCYGPDAVDCLWDILNYGIQQKEELWNKLTYVG